LHRWGVHSGGSLEVDPPRGEHDQCEYRDHEEAQRSSECECKRRAQIQGISRPPKSRHVAGVATAEDRVARQFHRDQADELWVTDVTEHPTRDGKVYCAVVLDAWSRRVIGLSIDGSASPTTALVTSALGMAIGQRQPNQAQLFTATRAKPGSE